MNNNIITHNLTNSNTNMVEEDLVIIAISHNNFNIQSLNKNMIKNNNKKTLNYIMINYNNSHL